MHCTQQYPREIYQVSDTRSLAHLVTESGGLAAIIADTLTRESVLEAMRARRVYATNGPRILLRTALDSHPMGALIPKPEAGGYSGELFVRVVAEVEVVEIGVNDAVLQRGQQVHQLAQSHGHLVFAQGEEEVDQHGCRPVVTVSRDYCGGS